MSDIPGFMNGGSFLPPLAGAFAPGLIGGNGAFFFFLPAAGFGGNGDFATRTSARMIGVERDDRVGISCGIFRRNLPVTRPYAIGEPDAKRATIRQMFLIDTRGPDLTARSADFYCGDAVEVLNSLPAGTVDLTVTSPPYLLDKDYGDDQGDDYDYQDYLSWTRSWLAALYNATSPGGRLCLNIPLDTNKHGTSRQVYADILGGIKDDGDWSYRTSIVWNEGTINRRTAWGSYARPSAPCVTSAVEMVAVLYKGNAWRRLPNGRTWDIEPEEFKAWTITPWDIPNSTPRSGHPAPFCEELPRRLIKLYSYREDLICDPFAGTCTTNVVAEKLGRRSIGIDLELKWLQHGADRVSEIDTTTDAAGVVYRQNTMLSRIEDVLFDPLVAV